MATSGTALDQRVKRALGSSKVAPTSQQPPTAAAGPIPGWRVLHLQRTIGNHAVARLVTPAAVQRAAAGQPLPAGLRGSAEAASGVSLSDVRVHYDDARPAQISAAAYTNGQDLYIGPGHEQSLTHETWHAVQQAQGRVVGDASVADHDVSENPALEHEADTMSDRLATSAARFSHSSAPALQQPTRSGSSVAQCAILGLENIQVTSDVPEDWVNRFIADLTDPTTHLGDEDIIVYLSINSPGWHQDVKFINTGHNHWDVEITQPMGAPIIIQTSPDGNCAAHAAHAAINRAGFHASTAGYQAPAQFITAMRIATQQRVQGDRVEVKRRIISQIQHSYSVAESGFGPSLSQRLSERERAAAERMASSMGSVGALPVTSGAELRTRPFKRFERLLALPGVNRDRVVELMIRTGADPEQTRTFVDTWTPGRAAAEGEAPKSSSSGELDAATLRARVLALETELMDLVDFEQEEALFLRDVQTLMSMKFEPLLKRQADARKKVESAKTQQEQEAAKRELASIDAELAPIRTTARKQLDKYEEASQRRIAQHREEFAELLTPKRLEWMGLMAELCGTHSVPATQSWTGLAHRHDAQPGNYGRPPTAQDSLVGGRKLEVLFGHGGWYRTGLLSRGLMDPQMPGLTSLGEILDQANAIRRGKQRPELAANKVDLAFVGYHGKTIMMDRVREGAGPQLMDVPLELQRRVFQLMDEAHQRHADPDEYVKAACSKVTPPSSRQLRRNPNAEGTFEWTDRPAWEAYQRIKKGTRTGARADYADILEASAHGSVRFPESKLAYAIEHYKSTEAAREAKMPGYRFSTVLDIPGNDERVDLTTAVVTRLSEIEADDRPVRVVWAACRSEQWPKGFGDQMFLEWLKDAAQARRRHSAPPKLSDKVLTTEKSSTET